MRKQCPVCKCHRKRGSGGWAVEFNCGTRWGNMSETIVWRGKKCLEKEKGRKLTPEESKQVRITMLRTMYGLD